MESNELFNLFLNTNARIQKISQIYLSKDLKNSWINNSWSQLINSYNNITQNTKYNPQKINDAFQEFNKANLELATNLANGSKSIDAQDIKDKRFKNETWQKHPIFSYLKESYIIINNFVSKIVNEVEIHDKNTATKIKFYSQLIIDAVSPSNFIISNPDVLETTILEHGENILDGLDNLISDLQASNGRLNIKMTDLKAFKVGDNIAITKGKVIYQNDLIQLIQYNSKTKTNYEIPLLIIPPWINKYYILDLTEKKSFITWMVNQGYSVFLISWVNPTAKHSGKCFENYLKEGTIAAIDAIRNITKQKQINALGYCIGGTLLSCTLAYLKNHKKNIIKSASYITTMIDFNEPGDLGVFIDEAQIQSIENLMAEQGYLDGQTMGHMFNLLRANDLIWPNYIKNYLQGKNPQPFDLLYWNSDSTNLPKAMHSFYLRNMYLNNKLCKKNGIELLNTEIDISTIKVPAYFISTELDHIAPWKSTYSGMKLHSGKTTFVLGGSGHIAGVVNPPINNKYYYYTNSKNPKNPDTFLKTAIKNDGSWWPHFENWLKEYSGKKIKNYKIGNKKFPILEDAPGSYVKVSHL